MVRKPSSFSFASCCAMTVVSLDGVVSDHGSAASWPRQNLENNARMSSMDVGVSQSFRPSSLDCLIQIPYPSSSPYAGERESPKRPFGYSSQFSVRER